MLDVTTVYVHTAVPNTVVPVAALITFSCTVVTIAPTHKILLPRFDLKTSGFYVELVVEKIALNRATQ